MKRFFAVMTLLGICVSCISPASGQTPELKDPVLIQIVRDLESDDAQTRSEARKLLFRLAHRDTSDVMLAQIPHVTVRELHGVTAIWLQHRDERIVRALLDRLEKGGFKQPVSLGMMLTEVRSPQVDDRMVRMLDNEDAEVVDAAMLYLRLTGNYQAWEKMLDRAAQQVPGVMSYFAGMGRPDVMKPLRKRLWDPDLPIEQRLALVDVCAEIQEGFRAEIATDLAADPAIPERLRVKAANKLPTSQVEPAKQFYSKRYQQGQRLSEAALLRAWARTGDPRALGPVLQTAKTAEAELRALLARDSWRIESQEITDLLTGWLADDDLDVRIAASIALANRKEQSGRDALIRLVPDLSEHQIDALRYRLEQPFEGLIGALLASCPSAGSRRQEVLAYVQFRAGEKDFESLQDFLTAHVHSLRQEELSHLLIALCRTGSDKAIPYVLQGHTAELRRFSMPWLQRRLESFDPVKINDELKLYLSDSQWQSPEWIFLAARLQLPGTPRRLMTLLDKENLSLKGRIKALEYLGSFAEDQAIAYLLKIAESNDRWHLVEAALSGLARNGKLRDPRALARKLISSKNCAIRAAAARLLGTIGQPRDISGLTGLLKDPSVWVRSTARFSLLQIAGENGAMILLKDQDRLSLNVAFSIGNTFRRYGATDADLVRTVLSRHPLANRKFMAAPLLNSEDPEIKAMAEHCVWWGMLPEKQ